MTLEGRTCLVTGATSGIGREIAAGLAAMGATVVLVGRSKTKCESALREIGGSSYLVADLSSQASVRQLAREFSESHRRLDILVNNAGVFLAKRTTTVDGIEYTLAVNHLAPFLLTNLLMDVIRASSAARIITTSSVAHRGARIDFDDIQFENRSYSGIKAYAQSKLANILFTKELAARLEGTGVAANCFHPGAVRTNLLQGNPWHYRLVWNAAGSFFLTPEKGADTGIYLASSPDVEGISGKYFVKREVAEPSAEAQDMQSAVRLWKISEELTSV
ncbi:MAG TPA: SDR family oxidoreductase [Nitrososphaera sp.]|nr:SDR family oxidoreductase [Nitrososphaera sp.]